MARRLRTRAGIAVLATASALASSSVLAQSPSASDPADSTDTIELAAVASTKIVRSRGVAEAPVLDGDVLGDPAWANAEPAHLRRLEAEISSAAFEIGRHPIVIALLAGAFPGRLELLG